MRATEPSLRIDYRWEPFRGPAVPQVVIQQATPAEKIPGHRPSHLGFGADVVMQYGDEVEDDFRGAEIRLGFSGEQWFLWCSQEYKDGSVDAEAYYTPDLLAWCREAAESWTAHTRARSFFGDVEKTLWWEATGPPALWCMSADIAVSDAEDPVWWFPAGFDVLVAAERVAAMYARLPTGRARRRTGTRARRRGS